MQFEEGKEFYVDFTLVDATPAQSSGDTYEDGSPRI
jgi:hypothetical protein